MGPSALRGIDKVFFLITLKALQAFIYPLFEMTGQLMSTAREALQLVKRDTMRFMLKM